MTSDKITEEEMVDAVADKLVVYLKNGRLSPRSFLDKIDLQINNMVELLRLHFIIQDDVVKFIKKLPHRIRNIKTSTKKVNRTYKNQVRGRIDWQSTINNRYSQNYQDNTLFVCEQTNKNFDIKENIILKKLISLIYGIINRELKGKPESYGWLKEWQGEKNLAAGLEEFYFRNIYLNKIEIQEAAVTDRMIQDTKNSRNQLYREAAELLDLYREQVEREKWLEDSEEVKKLLNDTFIVPEEESVLFELYWVMKLLEHNTAQYQLELLKESQNIVARWENENMKYTLYHDCDGSKELGWSVKLSEFASIKNEYLQRKINGFKNAREISEIFQSPLKPAVWAGRPDLVLEVRDNKGELKKIVIGEIKYTNKEETAKQGLKELMEYCQLVKKKGKYIQNREIKINGLLLFDKIDLGANDYLQGIRVEKISENHWTWEEIFTDRIEI